MLRATRNNKLRLKFLLSDEEQELCILKMDIRVYRTLLYKLGY